MGDPHLTNGLNDITLSRELLVQLYGRSLVQPEQAEQAVQSELAEQAEQAEQAAQPEQAEQHEQAVQAEQAKPGEVAAAPATETTPAPKFLGSNEKRVLLLVNNKDVTFLSEEQLTLVTRMLKACGLNLGDIALVNLASGQEMADILPALQPGKLISFGALEPAATPPFPVVAKDGIDWLMAPSLGSLMQETGGDAPLKSALWKAMQQLFGIAPKK